MPLALARGSGGAGRDRGHACWPPQAREKYALAESVTAIFINAGCCMPTGSASASPCRLRSMVFHPRLVGGSADSVFWQKYLQPLLTDPSRPCAVLAPGGSRGNGRRMEAMEQAFRAVVNLRYREF